jgi:hypothetical protein
MSGPGPDASGLSRLWQAVLVLVGAAFGARLVWELLRPLLPALLAGAVLILLISWFRPHRW